MNMLTTARCRLAQALARMGRRARPAGKQELQTGAGAVLSVGQLLRDRKLRRPLVAAGAGEGLPRVKLLRALDEAGTDYVLWDELPDPPLLEDAERLGQAWAAQGCDSFIALGDGPVLDAVKAAAAWTASRERSIMSMARRRLPRHIAPVIAIPTVAGAGAEAMTSAGVQMAQGRLCVLRGEALLPAAAVLDPELLAEAPRDKAADAGLDGLCLAIEAFLAAPAGESGPRGQAAEAVELFFADLEPCWNSGGAIKERAELLAASRLAGRAASAAGCGYARALIRAAQTVCELPFRTACAVLLPAVLEKYGSYAEDKLAALSAMADLAAGGGRQERARALVARLRQLTFRLGLPDELEGLTAEQVQRIGYLAASEANPRYVSPVVWTAEECRSLVLSVCVQPEE